MTGGQQNVVSSDDEMLILVDEHDNEIGHLTKDLCHDGVGQLHRAFSIFLFDTDGKLMLQQRGADKRLWPGYWSNSCCSHPRRGESLEVATQRRLLDELNVSADLEFVYRFSYQAQFDDVGAERELCSVFLGREQISAIPNETEISALRYVSRVELDTELRDQGNLFTPWFKLEWDALCEDYADILSRFTRPCRTTS